MFRLIHHDAYYYTSGSMLSTGRSLTLLAPKGIQNVEAAKVQGETAAAVRRQVLSHVAPANRSGAAYSSALGSHEDIPADVDVSTSHCSHLSRKAQNALSVHVALSRTYIDSSILSLNMR